MLQPDDYLTDGVSLFRFECFLPEGEGVVLEDAWSERMWSVPMDEFTKMKLRNVRRPVSTEHLTA